jgi:hypothetical protein
MNRKINRTLLTATVAFTLLCAVAAFAFANSPALSPMSVVMSAGSSQKFNVAKSNNQVWEKWEIIESASGSKIDQQGNFTAGPTPGWVLVEVTTGDYGPNHPTIAHVQITP